MFLFTFSAKCLVSGRGTDRRGESRGRPVGGEEEEGEERGERLVLEGDGVGREGDRGMEVGCEGG